MRKLIPILFAILGGLAGIAAAYVVSPPSIENCEEDTPPCDTVKKPDQTAKGNGSEFVKMNNQFVVPIIKDDEVGSLVVVSLSLEVLEGKSELVYSKEPKLRDRFLQVLFDYAHLRGFDGAFANSSNLDRLKRDLRKAAHDIAGPDILDVLIIDMVRQDL